MGQPGPPRSAGDALLLREGWVTRERLVDCIRRQVMPGQAARAAAVHRKRSEDDETYASRRGDIYTVGERVVANDTISNAVRSGMWIREGDRYRHRDWKPPATLFAVPTSDQLDGVARLLTASDWEKAAIVAAHVTLDAGHGKRREFAVSYSASGFARLGFAGLTTKDTVVRYVKAWTDTGRPPPTPGEGVELPTVPFPRAAKAKRRPAGLNTRSNDADEWFAALSGKPAPFRKKLLHRLIEQERSEQGREARPPRVRTRGGLHSVPMTEENTA